MARRVRVRRILRVAGGRRLIGRYWLVPLPCTFCAKNQEMDCAMCENKRVQERVVTEMELKDEVKAGRGLSYW